MRKDGRFQIASFQGVNVNAKSSFLYYKYSLMLNILRNMSDYRGKIGRELRFVLTLMWTM